MQRLLCLLLVSAAHAQIVIDMDILNSDQNLQPSVLNPNLQQHNVPTASALSSHTGSDVLVVECGTGTFAEGGASTCTSCAAGTASAVIGARTHLTCQSCSSGSFSGEAASQCTQCGVGTFSATVSASSSASCLACPPHSNSTQGSSAVTSCTCDSSYFLPLNQLQALDPAASVQFGVWDSLPTGTSVLDVPHVNCAGLSRRLLSAFSSLVHAF
jgi:hypothetical protein